MTDTRDDAGALPESIQWLKNKDVCNRYTLAYMAESAGHDDNDAVHINTLFRAIVDGGLVLAALSQPEAREAWQSVVRKFYHSEWSIPKLLEARNGGLVTDEGEAWVYVYSHKDGTGGEYDLLRRREAPPEAQVTVAEDGWLFMHNTGHYEAFRNEEEAIQEADKYDRRMTVEPFYLKPPPRVIAENQLAAAKRTMIREAFTTGMEAALRALGEGK